jgi:hypothetical protein
MTESRFTFALALTAPVITVACVGMRGRGPERPSET